MLNIRSVVLGSTPIRTTSRHSVARRQLFTPVTSPNNSPVQDANQSAVDVNTRPGTMVIRIEEDGHPYSGKTGVILRTTAGPSPTTLDILWNVDGTISTDLPSNLRLMQIDQTPTATSTVTPPPASSAIPSHQSDTTNSRHGYKPVLPTKLPKHLRQSCPLDSISPQDVELFQIRMDNYLSAGHPNVRLLIMGKLESPLLDYLSYIRYMERLLAPQPFVFDHADAELHIQQMQSNGDHQLAMECEQLLDNRPYFDGFRPCNSAVYFAMLDSLKHDDLYIMRGITHGDGIRLRNKIWDSMTGDAVKSKKLMDMSMSQEVSDLKYQFL